MDLEDLAKQTPLFYACSYKQHQMVTFLTQSGADYDHTDNEGRTALMWAASNSSLPCVKALCKAGCDITIRDTKQRVGLTQGWMAADWATELEENNFIKIKIFLTSFFRIVI